MTRRDEERILPVRRHSITFPAVSDLCGPFFSSLSFSSSVRRSRAYNLLGIGLVPRACGPNWSSPVISRARCIMCDPRTTTASPFSSRPTCPSLAFIPVSLLLVLLVAAGCGGADDTTTTTPVTTTNTTTVVGTTAPSPPTIGEPGVFPRPDTTTGPLPGSEGAGGSGCAPGTTSLPDGIWFGFVTAKADTSIMFDLACFFFGPIASEEGAKDDVDVDNEIYIRNAKATVRTITVDPSVPVYEYFEDLTDTIEVPFKPVPFADWPQDPTFPNPCPGEFCGVWLFVNDAAVTEMLEQLVP